MSGTIRRLLVANRGEIALRIIRSARSMGIETVAVYSDADAQAQHVLEADLAVHVGASPSSESYLLAERILAACAQTQADAVHPGYGFLSENAAFAAACRAAGLTFVGPTAEAIEQMGSKRASKELAVAAGVPVVPGYYGRDQDDARLIREAEAIGFPVLFKASAGGGGRGMRLVRHASEVASAIQEARSESLRAFGDDVLLVEKYIDHPRHIEIQILADHHGHVIHLGERECSIQRRHQKVLEESPSPFVDAELRARMGSDAVQLAQQIGYRNAGTVEFIVDPQGNYYFLEMNTRLQVEHPVTELVTGIDLVRAQLQIASGHVLPWTQDAVQLTGSAIEARLYAEDPENHFLPASGHLWRWRFRDEPGLRVDSGVAEGDEVSVHYDPMLAKVIAHAPTRAEASARLERGLRGLEVAGVQTNRDFLVDVLQQPAWRDGATHTHFIDDHFPQGWSSPTPTDLLHEAALAATIWDYDQRMRARTHLPSLQGAFRNSRLAPSKAQYLLRGERLEVAYVPQGRSFVAGEGTWLVGTAEAGEPAVPWRYRLRGDQLSLRSPEGLARSWSIAARDSVEQGEDRRRYLLTSLASAFEIEEAPRFPIHQEEQVLGSCVAPMNGTVLRLAVQEGDEVIAGQTLLVLEAMKMEHRVSAPEDGVVDMLSVREGDLVNSGQLLAIVQPS